MGRSSRRGVIVSTSRLGLRRSLSNPAVVAALLLWGLLAAPAVRAGADDHKPLHGAPRGPMADPDPNPPQGQPDARFFQQLVQAKGEMNAGGRTCLMEISRFEVRAARESAEQEEQPFRSHARVTPILVKWTAVSYGQTDDTRQSMEQTWICWQNESGVWLAATTGDAKAGDIESADHPSR
jgi:hypothetical protein